MEISNVPGIYNRKKDGKVEMNGDFSKVVAVIPSLRPDDKLLTVVKSLFEEGFRRVIVVDDGSGDAYRERFERCAALSGVTLLTHPVNRGKGAAIKTAFAYILEKMKNFSGAITVDGDAQHCPEDCRRCAEAMIKDDRVVLGVRDFSGAAVPKRSRMGNRTTSLVFKIFCGMKLSDTQTGLRAFPADILPKMLETRGERYEYETQMLLDFKTYKIPYEEIVIRTVYIEDNNGSHFRAVRDSFRIYRMIFGHFVKYSAMSVISYFIEWAIMSGVLLLLNNATERTLLQRTAIAFLCARAVSSVFNFVVNYKLVFKAKCSMLRALYKYYALCVPLAAIGLFLNLLGVKGVSVWGFLPEAVEEYAQLVIHPLVQMILFVVTYGLQREWVYRTDAAHQIKRKKKRNRKE